MILSNIQDTFLESNLNIIIQVDNEFPSGINIKSQQIE